MGFFDAKGRLASARPRRFSSRSKFEETPVENWSCNRPTNRFIQGNITIRPQTRTKKRRAEIQQRKVVEELLKYENGGVKMYAALTKDRKKKVDLNNGFKGPDKFKSLDNVNELNATSHGAQRGSVASPPTELGQKEFNPQVSKCVIPKPRKEIVTKMVDLCQYRPLKDVLEANSNTKGFNLFKHSLLMCQPELRMGIGMHDPTLPSEVKLRIIQKEKDKVARNQEIELEAQRKRDKEEQQEEAYSVEEEEDEEDLAQLIIARQRELYSKYKPPKKPARDEVFEDYLRELKACDMTYGDAPSQFIEHRIRRRIMEGSYPNWTVEEDNLPTLLRYVGKGKLKKILHYLQDVTKHYKVNNEDDRGRTSLHYAASWGCLKTLNILLQVPRIELNKRDEHGKTPLYKAVEINSFDCVKALLDAGANPRITARDSRDPLTAIMHLHGDERFDMFKFLYEKGRHYKDEIKPYSVTLLHKAIAAEKETVNLQIVNFLIENGHDMLAKEGKSRTPLHLAVIFGHTDLLYLLLAHEVNIFHVDDEMKIAINYAPKHTLSRAILDEFCEYGPPPVEQAVTCRKAGDDLDICSVLCNNRCHQQW